MLRHQKMLYILLLSKNSFFIISILFFFIDDKSFSNRAKMIEKVANLGNKCNEYNSNPKPALNFSALGYLVS